MIVGGDKVDGMELIRTVIETRISPKEDYSKMFVCSVLYPLSKLERPDDTSPSLASSQFLCVHSDNRDRERERERERALYMWI